jgi:hypothetical protein
LAAGFSQRNQSLHSTIEDPTLQLEGNKIDRLDLPETTEGHHADYNTDAIGPDQRGEGEDQQAACNASMPTAHRSPLS